MRLIKYSRYILSSYRTVNAELGILRYISCQSSTDDIEIQDETEVSSPRPSCPNYIDLQPQRRVPLSYGEYEAMQNVTPQQPLNPHYLKVSILGEPNAGKSTLTNALVKWKVCPVSKKVHTTRNKAAVVLVDGNKQIEFLDTPGFVTAKHGIKHHLEISLVVDPETSVREADLVAVIVDCANKWTNNRINPEILKLLNDFKEKKSILVLNKMDAKKKKQELLPITRILTRGFLNGIPSKSEMKKKIPTKKKATSLEEMFLRTEKLANSTGDEPPEVEEPVTKLIEPPEYFDGAKGWPYFSRVFLVSALNDEGVDELRDYLFQSTLPSEWKYHKNHIINKDPYELAIAIARQILLEDLPQEIPYSLNLDVKQWEIDTLGCLRITISIQCPKLHYKRLVLGKSGQRIAKFVEQTRQALQDTFRSEIYLKMYVY